MRALLLAALAVLTLSVATAAFAEEGGGNGGQNAKWASNGEYHG
jgi:hypothetical protein